MGNFETDRRQRLEEQAVLSEHLDILAALNVRAQTIQGEINQHVLKLRSEGTSWASIGAALGMSAQAAHQRWSPGGKEKHRIRQQNRDPHQLEK